MFVVMGSTGQTGGAALRALRGVGEALRAVVRSPRRLGSAEGVEPVVADAGDAEALAAAFAGAKGVYAMVPSLPQAEDVMQASRRLSLAIAEAVRVAHVSHVVALSSEGAYLDQDSGMIGILHDFEAALRTTGAALTFLRPADFMENWAAALPAAQSEGILPTGRAPIDAATPTVSALDVGRTAAELLLDPPSDRERIVNLVGPKPYSPNDAARILSGLLGREIRAVTVARAEALAALMAAGASRDYADKLIAIDEGVNAGRITFEPVGEMRHGVITLEEVLRRLVEGTPR